jgi:hypothetical protein
LAGTAEAAETTFVDDEAEPGLSYRYWVVAAVHDLRSPRSEVDCARAAPSPSVDDHECASQVEQQGLAVGTAGTSSGAVGVNARGGGEGSIAAARATGDARAPVAASGQGSCNGESCPAANPDAPGDGMADATQNSAQALAERSPAEGHRVSEAGLGADVQTDDCSRSRIAVSLTGCSHGTVAVSATGSASGLLAASITGPASAGGPSLIVPGVAASVFGPASTGPGVAVSATDSASAWIGAAASGTGDANAKSIGAAVPCGVLLPASLPPDE